MSVTPDNPHDLASGISTGTRHQYHWLTSTEQYMGHLVRLCPDVLLGRYLIVTSIDSGSPWLTTTQRAAGWSLHAGGAYSSRISSVEELFFQRDGDGAPGYDEWYVLDSAPAHIEVLDSNPFEKDNGPQMGRLLVFVNSPFFVLHDPGPVLPAFNERFWRQLEEIQPFAYISDGKDNLTFVCKDKELFESVQRRLCADCTLVP